MGAVENLRVALADQLLEKCLSKQVIAGRQEWRHLVALQEASEFILKASDKEMKKAINRTYEVVYVNLCFKKTKHGVLKAAKLIEKEIEDALLRAQGETEIFERFRGTPLGALRMELLSRAFAMGLDETQLFVSIAGASDLQELRTLEEQLAKENTVELNV